VAISCRTQLIVQFRAAYQKEANGRGTFTSYFSKESPGRAAVWLGFRIIESYMMKNKNNSLADIMKDTDIQGILEKARYNPK